MSPKIAGIYLLAIIATIVGWSQSLIYKEPPLTPLALWFPMIVVTRTSGLCLMALSFAQFPLFATAFAIGIQRWSVARVVIALACIYAILVGIAFAMID